jgi:galactokinase
MPQVLCRAPGRINLIGEHTDYNEGFVFPAAIDRWVQVAARRTDGGTTLYSDSFGEWEFDVNELGIEDLQGWGAYPAGVAWALQGADRGPIPNIEATVSSDLPPGSGLSSSAALEMAFLSAWLQLAGISMNGKEAALLAQYSENEFVGVECGAMDQLACALGKRGHALFIDTRSLEIQFVPLPDSLSLVVCQTGKERSLADSAYNDRREECSHASASLGVPMLRDATMSMLEAARKDLGEVGARRARHVVTENLRCESFRQALIADDRMAIGSLMRASHESLRDDFEVSCRELDAMVQACWDAPGCVGARMTGAGFGGACVALVEAGSFDAFADATGEEYFSATGIVPEIVVCQAADGVSCASL